MNFKIIKKRIKRWRQLKKLKRQRKYRINNINKEKIDNQIGIYNYMQGNYIWYHSTLNGLVDSIQKEGLKILSIPTFQDQPEPWIYVGAYPFTNEKDFSTFAVDLSYLPWDKAGWPFGEEEKPNEERYQLRILENIPPKYLRLLSRNETEILIQLQNEAKL